MNKPSVESVIGRFVIVALLVVFFLAPLWKRAIEPILLGVAR